MIRLDAKELDDLDASCELHHSRGWHTKDEDERAFIVQAITKIPKLTQEIRELRSAAKNHHEQMCRIEALCREVLIRAQGVDALQRAEREAKAMSEDVA